MYDLMGMSTGFVIGAAVVLIVWGIAVFSRGRAQKKANETREKTISSIEGKWADIERLVSAARGGRMPAAAFKNSLRDQCEAINREFLPNIHRLDIFFVKYTEKLLAEYGGMAEAGASVPAGEAGARAVLEPLPVLEAPPVQEYAAAAVIDGAATIVAPAGHTAAAAEQAAPADAAEIEEAATLFAPAEQAAAAMEQAAPAAAAVAAEEAPPEQTATEAGGIVVSPEEEPVITAMTQEAVMEAELPLETFLEMGTGTGMADDTATAIQPVEEIEETSAPVQHETERLAAVEEKKEFVLPPSPESAVTRDETVQPATIYDVEAETIIADRSEVFKTAAPAPSEADKSNLGITGDDVSDMLDRFFSSGKR